ncbi:M10 family metallopeptidase C-terminal domain-containing protein [Novosphingobium sp.]|uniref:M10 family metallopeptidase C-terminal domain-containing protein n=1 Tax=Novosphingobium sp. TaxID=1874826 RepID=UPI001EB646DB|nr:M10 family metallopeptidase C-terminal domain-containing protein [Novosphingobium sp.]MBK9010018.1 M10 family metallopeptidase [Novosphingobium sp.]
MLITASQSQIEGWLRSPGFSLGSNQFTYSVSTAQSIWPGYGSGSEPLSPSYSFADAALASGFRAAIAVWDSLIAPDFAEVADDASKRGEVRIAYTDTESSLGYAYSSTPTAPGGLSGDIWMSSSKKGESWSSGTSLFEGLLHEIGHTLGLKHTFDSPAVPASLDDSRYSIMSYTHKGVFWTFSQSGNLLTSLGDYPAALTPMVLDIAAAHAIYGPETTTRTGNNVYTFTQWQAVFQTIYDAGGSDTIDISNFTLPSVIDLRPGSYSSIGMASAATQVAYWSALFPGFSSFIASVINGEEDLFTFTDNLGIAFGTVIENAVGGTGADTLTGNEALNLLTGGLGNDTIDGGSNVDTALVSGNRAAYTVTQTSTGVFSVTGPDGTDTLTNVEYIQFADQKVRLLPGTGTSVDFNANPASYMAAIRDFDGNDVGAAADWKRIGAADVNGDGDVDQIFVNRTNGRFAEVATAPDGKVYFSDHGWAGETRVVGIYIDPLVQSGQVVAGGPNDSQRRFQNDLKIENINGVLGAGDYDRDRLQEVYFKLTDGTAYLHAYMHADGNIRYANYQSQQQVIDFLTQNGWASSTYDGWFS